LKQRKGCKPPKILSEEYPKTGKIFELIILTPAKMKKHPTILKSSKKAHC